MSDPQESSSASPSAPSILQEPAPNSIDQLLQMDPRLYSDEQLDTLIAHYRAQRVQFLELETANKAAGKKTTKLPKPKGETEKLAASLSLNDLLG